MTKEETTQRYKIIKQLNDKTFDISKLPPNNIFLQYKLNNETIEETIKRWLINKQSFTINKLYKYNILTTETKITQPSLVKPKEYNIFGCPLSTDIDIIISCCIDLNENIDIEFLKQELKDLGYTNTSLDINLVYIENGLITKQTKGGKETQNMVYYTYKHHKQKHKLLCTKPIDIDIQDNIKSIAKFILDYSENLLTKEEYQKERLVKQQIYCDATKRIQHSIDILNQSSYTDIDINKSLVMKFTQLILIDNNIYAYTKVEIADEFDKLYPNTKNGILYYLTRHKQGVYDKDILPFLISKYKQYTQSKQEQIQFKLNLTNLTNLEQEFIKSPLQPTKDFIILFKSLCKDKSINSFFQGINCNEDKLPTYVKYYSVSQKSKEWFDLNKTLKNEEYEVLTYDKEDWIEHYYNLIRGCIIENIITNYTDFDILLNEKCIKIMTGIITNNTQVISPDLILLTQSNVFIPVEIKTIPEKPSNNHNNARTLHMSKVQLRTAMNILKTNSGIIIIVYIYDNIIDCRYMKINFFI